MYNNKFELAGEIVTEFEFSHAIYDEKFYKAMLRSERNSGVADIIPIIVSDKIMDMSYSWLGEIVSLQGQYRSYTEYTEEKNKHRLFMFVDCFSCEYHMGDINHVELNGYVVKEPNFRRTGGGRLITDLMIAVNRPTGKTDYIPLIFWSRNAAYASTFEKGTHIEIVGRVQSREYWKKLSETESETRVAYEVSVQSVWEV